jgi:predicted DNA-binding protein with PD1-like motif
MSQQYQQRENHSIFDREKGVLIGSLTKGTDLMDGIIAECAKHGIESGAVTCIGSLETATYVHGVEGPDGNPAYSETKVIQGPMELLNGTGFLCRNDQDQLDMHFHGMIVDKEGRIWGGHFLRGKNPILVTLEFIMTTGESVRATRSFDQGLGFQVINFKLS